jgi:nitrile hydratase subunit alpha
LSEHEHSGVAARARELEQRLIAAGAVTDAEIDGFIAVMYKGTPVNGARMVARAWTNPGYRRRLLADGSAAGAELGFDWMNYDLKVVANGEREHNVIVCTLCSCYPVSLLGPSPGWYKSFA